MKRAFCIVLSLVMILSALAGTAPYSFAAEDGSPAQEIERVPGETVTVVPEDLPELSDMFAAYVDRAFSKDTTKDRNVISGADALTSQNDILAYNKLAEYIALVAAGERSSTVFELTTADFGISKNKFTAEDLGVESLLVTNGSETNLNDAAVEALRALVAFDYMTVVKQLLYSLPYDLYWFDKVTGYAYGGPSIAYGWSEEYPDGYLYMYMDQSGYVAMVVASAYALNGEYFEFDTTIGKSVQSSAARAKAIVKKYTSKSDYEKVLAYKDEICGLVEYNYDVLEGDPDYGDPWQVIWVFDDDPTTNVVCEGYSKAFQYLCQLSDFRSSKVTCVSATGTMFGNYGSGPHMWNILSMDDGANYLVDVTNCDSDMIGDPDLLFLKGASGSVSGGYSFNCYSATISYAYDTDSLNLFSQETLTLSPTDYAGPQSFDLGEWTYTVSGTIITLGTYSGNAEEYRIPKTITKNGKEYTLAISSSTKYGSIRELSFDEGFSLPTDCTGLFKNKSALVSIDLSGVDASPVTAMSQMFYGCSGLQMIDVPLNVRDLGDSLCAALPATFYSVGGNAYTKLPAGVTSSFRIYRRYTVTWDIDGVLETENYLYSFMPSHEDPVKAADKQYAYTFAGWDPEITPVTGDAIYTALFTKASLIPTISSLTNGDTNSGITVNWTAQAICSKFRIQRKATGESKWTTVISAATGTSYVDKTAKTGGATYTYRIAGYHDGVWTDYSETASIVRNPFTDVKTSASYFKALCWAYNNGIVAGTSTTKFSPNDNCTRGQFALMLWRMNGKPSTAGLENPFTDVKSNNGFYNGIVWCYNKGITAGTSATTFSPNNNITRWQMILMFWRMQGKPKSSLTENPFTDVKTTASYYKAALWAYENKITAVEKFMPNDLCTRWQLVLFLYRLNNLYHYI